MLSQLGHFSLHDPGQVLYREDISRHGTGLLPGLASGLFEGDDPTLAVKCHVKQLIDALDFSLIAVDHDQVAVHLVT